MNRKDYIINKVKVWKIGDMYVWYRSRAKEVAT